MPVCSVVGRARRRRRCLGPAASAVTGVPGHGGSFCKPAMLHYEGLIKRRTMMFGTTFRKACWQSIIVAVVFVLGLMMPAGAPLATSAAIRVSSAERQDLTA